MTHRQQVAYRCILLKGVPPYTTKRDVQKSVQLEGILVKDDCPYCEASNDEKRWIVLLNDEKDAKRLLDKGNLLLKTNENEQEVVIGSCPDCILPEDWITDTVTDFDISMHGSIGVEHSSTMSRESSPNNLQGLPSVEDTGNSSEEEQDKYIPQFVIPTTPVSNVKSWADSQKIQPSKIDQGHDINDKTEECNYHIDTENGRLDSLQQFLEKDTVPVDQQRPQPYERIPPVHQPPQNGKMPSGSQPQQNILFRQMQNLDQTLYQNYNPAAGSDYTTDLLMGKRKASDKNSDEPPVLPPRIRLSQQMSTSSSTQSNDEQSKSVPSVYQNVEVRFDKQQSQFKLLEGQDQPEIQPDPSFGMKQPQTQPHPVYGTNQPQTQPHPIYGTNQPQTQPHPVYGTNQPQTAQGFFNFPVASGALIGTPVPQWNQQQMYNLMQMMNVSPHPPQEQEQNQRQSKDKKETDTPETHVDVMSTQERGTTPKSNLKSHKKDKSGQKSPSPREKSAEEEGKKSAKKEGEKPAKKEREKPAEKEREVDNSKSSQSFKAIRVVLSAPLTEDSVILYFENTRKSGGGDIEDAEWIYVEDDDTVKEGVITFVRSEDAQNVLAKGVSHDINKTIVKVEKYDPSDPSIWEDKKILVTNMHPSTTDDCLFNFLEPKANSRPIRKLTGENPSVAIVCFDDKPDFDKLKRASEAKLLEKRKIKISKVRTSKAVCVSGIIKEMSKDLLENFFENKKRSGGGDVERIEYEYEDGICIVHFHLKEDAENVCSKSPVMLSGKSLTVYPYYECLGPPKPDLQDMMARVKQKIVKVDDINPNIIRFIYKTVLKKDLEDKLGEINARIEWGKPVNTEYLLIKCTVTEITSAIIRELSSWENAVCAMTQKFLSQLRSEKLYVMKEVWDDFLQRLKTLNIEKPDKVGVILEKKEFAVATVGEKVLVEDLVKELKAIISHIEAKQQHGSKTVPLEIYKLIYLIKLQFGKKIKQEFPDVSITMALDKKQIVIDGKPNDIDNVYAKVLELWTQVVEKTMIITKGMDLLLQQTKVREMLTEGMKAIKAVWNVKPGSDILKIFAKTGQEAKKAEVVIRNTVKEKTFDVPDNIDQLLASKEWQSLVSEIHDEKQFVGTRENEIEVAATKDMFDSVVSKVERQVNEFQAKHSTGTDFVPVNYDRLKWIEYFGWSEVRQIQKDFDKSDIKIMRVFQPKKNGLKISGQKTVLSAVKGKLSLIVGSVIEDKYHFSKQGYIDYFDSPNGKDTLKRTGKAHQCFIKMTNQNETSETGSGEKQKRRNKLSPRKVAEVTIFQTKIFVMGGDITQLKVDVIVNAANEDMDHCGGLAKAISKAAGAKVDNECKRYVSENGKVRTGSVMISSPGNLPCKKIIHAVGPVWEGGLKDEDSLLKNAVYKCLKKTASEKLKSIAIPALSAGIFGYPLRKAVNIITDTIFFYLASEDGINSDVKEVYLCDTDHRVISAFKQVLKDKYGSMVTVYHNQADSSDDEEMHTGTGHTHKGESSARKGRHAGIQISVIKEELAKVKADAIVNSAHHSLDLTIGATSNSLLIQGGQSIQEECRTKYSNGVRIGKVAITKGGKLRCDQVYHGTLQRWDFGRGEALKNLQTFVDESLKLAHENKLTSIAFPALGTGQLGYPADVVAKQMYHCVARFEEKNTKTTVAKVYLVIYPKDTATFKAFEYVSEKVKHGEGATGGSHDYRKEDSRSHRQSDDDGDTKQLGKLTVKVEQGDITKERADAIINSVGDDLDLSRGAVSRAILRAAGKEIQDECRDKGAMKKYGYVTSSGGKMSCSYIIHVRAQRTADGWEDMISRSLEVADRKGCKMVAFPALGTGGQGCSPKGVAKAMFKAIHDFSPNKNLRQACVIVFQEEMVEMFQRELYAASAGIIGKAITAVKKGLGMMESEPDPGVCLSLWSDKYQNIKAAKHSLDKILEEEFSAVKIDNFKDTVKNLHEKQVSVFHQNIKVVNIHISTRNGVITLQGQKKKVFEAKSLVVDMLRDFEVRQRKQEQAGEIKKYAQWQYEDSSKKWRNFNPLVNAEVEKVYKDGGTTVTVKDRSGVEYCVDLKKKVEYEKRKPANYYNIRRFTPGERDNASMGTPSTWTGNKNVTEVLLKPGDKEYERVKQEFSKTSSSNTIVKLYRVENTSLYLQYTAKRKEIQDRNGKNPEQWLWHGTCATTIENIITNGFNRSYCGKNGTACGNGVYFAVNSSYSVGFCSPDTSGNKHIFSVQVLTGESCQGNSGLRYLPVRPGAGKSVYTYDSATDNPSRPQMFVIFHDSQAYPTYHIVFK